MYENGDIPIMFFCRSGQVEVIRNINCKYFKSYMQALYIFQHPLHHTTPKQHLINIIMKVMAI